MLCTGWHWMSTVPPAILSALYLLKYNSVKWESSVFSYTGNNTKAQRSLETLKPTRLPTGRTRFPESTLFTALWTLNIGIWFGKQQWITGKSEMVIRMSLWDISARARSLDFTGIIARFQEGKWCKSGVLKCLI